MGAQRKVRMYLGGVKWGVRGKYDKNIWNYIEKNDTLLQNYIHKNRKNTY